MNQPAQPYLSQRHEPQYVAAPVSKQPAVIVGVDIPFWDMVKLIVTFSIASIPAMMLVFFIFMVMGLLFSAVFGGIGAMLM